MLFKRGNIWPYLQLMRWDKPTGLLLLLWPTLWALWSAGKGHVSVAIVIVFVMGVIFMRAAGCIINDLADRKFDGLVERTKNRPLVTKQISVFKAWMTLLSLCGCSFILVLYLNKFCLILAIISLPMVGIYPLLKRVIKWPQLGLGIVFNLGVLMAYAAVLNALPWQAWLLYGCGICWTVAYDTIYALVDKADDLKVGIYSTAITWGNRVYAYIWMLYLLFYLGLIIFGLSYHLSFIFFSFIIVAMGLSWRTLWLISKQERAAYWKAFKGCHYEGAIIFLGILSSYLSSS